MGGSLSLEGSCVVPWGDSVVVVVSSGILVPSVIVGSPLPTLGTSSTSGTAASVGVNSEEDPPSDDNSGLVNNSVSSWPAVVSVLLVVDVVVGVVTGSGSTGTGSSTL